MTKVVTFFKEAKEELGKVIWPTRKELMQHTVVVVVVSLGIAAFLGILDLVFNSILKQVI